MIEPTEKKPFCPVCGQYLLEDGSFDHEFGTHNCQVVNYCDCGLDFYDFTTTTEDISLHSEFGSIKIFEDQRGLWFVKRDDEVLVFYVEDGIIEILEKLTEKGWLK